MSKKCQPKNRYQRRRTNLNRERFVNNFRLRRIENTCHHPTEEKAGILRTSRLISPIEAKGSSFTSRRIVVSKSASLGWVISSSEEPIMIRFS